MTPTKNNLKKLAGLLRAYAEANLQSWIKQGQSINYGICMGEARELESLINLPISDRRSYF
jgi:hypothetical protein